MTRRDDGAPTQEAGCTGTAIGDLVWYGHREYRALYRVVSMNMDGTMLGLRRVDRWRVGRNLYGNHHELAADRAEAHVDDVRTWGARNPLFFGLTAEELP